MRSNRSSKHVVSSLEWNEITGIKLINVQKYLILSGGLGGSAYVEAKIKEKYSTSPHSSAPNMIVLVSDEPRLAVVRGM
jgi:hypothetical protein